MATITSSGAGSGLNINSLVTQLVAAERAPYDIRITRSEAKLNTEFTALAQLKGSMSAFQVALGALKKTDDFALRTTTVGDPEAFAASASAAAASGVYDVEVQQLAKAAKLGSTAVAGGAQAVLGAGTLTISRGSTSFDVTLQADSTLADLRDAINEATGNPGVQATLITDITGTHLVLGGGATGATNALRVTATGGNAALDAFLYDPPTTTNMASLATAQDAIVVVSGYEIHDADNNIEDAIEGVTLSLKKAEPGETISLSIATDEAGIRSRVDNFIKAYNNLSTQIAKLRAYDPETKAAGPLLGDAMLRNVESQLRRIISDPVSTATGNYNSLAALGITSAVNGNLTLDETRFNSALSNDRAAVSRVFASEQGVAVRLDTFIKDRLSTTGEITARDTRIESRRKDITKQKQTLETRMEIIQARYQRQFSALDSMLTQLQSTSSYLAQQLSAAAAR